MSHSSQEPRNWYYALLNAASVVFVVTVLAYALVPVLEQKAAQAGQPAPPSAFRFGPMDTSASSTSCHASIRHRWYRRYPRLC